MAWNEPGGSGRDPWGGRNEGQQPPDLDEILRKLQRRLGGLFGGGGPSLPTSGGGSGGLVAIALLLLAVWGVYDATHIIDESTRGVVTRFGKVVDTVQPGMSFRWPRPIERVEKVNVTQVNRMPLQAQLLTKDLNIIVIDLVVQFKVKDEVQYLYRVRNPDISLQESTESALRQVVGGKTMDDILSKEGGRDELVNETRVQIQQVLDKYETGLQVTKVNLNNTQPPEEVQEAFQDAIKAEEDEDTLKKQAQAYSRDIIPKAEGDAERIIQEAEAYKQQVVNKSAGEASRFLQTYTEYKKAPEVTRKRLYIETMESMLGNTTKVMVNVDKGNNILYLPLERFTGTSSEGLPPAAVAPLVGEGGGTMPSETERDSARSRERRAR